MSERASSICLGGLHEEEESAIQPRMTCRRHGISELEDQGCRYFSGRQVVFGYIVLSSSHVRPTWQQEQEEEASPERTPGLNAINKG